MSTTATYTYPSTTQYNWIGLASIGSNIYAALNSAGIYSVNKSTGAPTLIYSGAYDWRGLVAVNGNLLCPVYGGQLQLINTSGTLLKSFGWDAWYGACPDPADTNVAYATCFGKSSSQLAVLNISAGTTQYKSLNYANYVGCACIGNYIYTVINGTGVSRINKTTFVEELICSEARNWVDLTTDGVSLYSCVGGGQIRRIDVTTGVSEIVGGDPVGDTTTRDWKCITYSATDMSLYVGIYGWEFWKLAFTTPAIPTASLTTTTINNDTNIVLSCNTVGSTIKYTLDGTIPSLLNGLVYSSAVPISKTTTLKFCSILPGTYVLGSTATYTYVCADGVSSLPTNNYDSQQTVTLSSPSTTAQIYYTLDGTTPTTASTLYSGPFTINAEYTLKILVAKTGCTDSAITTYTYSRNIASYYLLPLTEGIASRKLAATPEGQVFTSLLNDWIDSNSALHPVGEICTIDPANGQVSYWSSGDAKNHLYAVSGKLCIAGEGTMLGITSIDTSTGAKGTYKIWYYPYSNWTHVVYNASVLYAFKDGYIYNGFTAAANTITKLTTVSKTVRAMTSHSSKIYVADTSGIYTVSTSNGAYTKLTSSSARLWTGLCSDGTYLYGTVDGGYIYKIDPTTGVDTILSGDTQTRAWTSITYTQGCLYASVTGVGIFKILTNQTITAIKIYTNSTWKTFNSAWVYHNSAWVPVQKMYKKMSGSWVRIA